MRISIRMYTVSKYPAHILAWKIAFCLVFRAFMLKLNKAEIELIQHSDQIIARFVLRPETRRRVMYGTKPFPFNSLSG